MNDTYIRRVQASDEKTLAHIQTESWKAAFRGIIPDEKLEELTGIDRAEKMYARLLAEDKGNGYILFADGKPHCIAWWDASREGDMPGYAELICIHSLPDNWRRGYGSLMMKRVLEDIGNAGWNKVMLWVFAENKRARAFYEKHGFVPSGKSKLSLGAEEIVYERSL